MKYFEYIDLYTNISFTVGCNKGSYQYKKYAQESVHQSPGVLLKYTYPVCELCPKGTFQSDKAARECQSCPQHHSTVGRGSASVEDCQGIKYYYYFIKVFFMSSTVCSWNIL